MTNALAHELNDLMAKYQPAFPVVITYEDGVVFNGGMLLRDYFAGQVITEVLRTPCKDPTLETAAHRAYMIADAMLAERKKTP